MAYDTPRVDSCEEGVTAAGSLELSRKQAQREHSNLIKEIKKLALPTTAARALYSERGNPRLHTSHGDLPFL